MILMLDHVLYGQVPHFEAEEQGIILENSTLSMKIKLTLSIAFPTFDTVLCRSLCSDAILCTVSRILFIVCLNITIWAAVNSWPGGTKKSIQITVLLRIFLLITALFNKKLI